MVEWKGLGYAEHRISLLGLMSEITWLAGPIASSPTPRAVLLAYEKVSHGVPSGANAMEENGKNGISDCGMLSRLPSLCTIINAPLSVR